MLAFNAKMMKIYLEKNYKSPSFIRESKENIPFILNDGLIILHLYGSPLIYHRKGYNPLYVGIS